nr:hypothetical protein KPHV_49720 [Kitasatospora purpeofusca]
MDEDVGAAAILGDEAEALLSVEPLDGSLSHAVLLARDVSGTTPCGTRSAALIALPPDGSGVFDIAEKLQKACGYMLRRLQVLQGESNCN